MEWSDGVKGMSIRSIDCAVAVIVLTGVSCVHPEKLAPLGGIAMPSIQKTSFKVDRSTDPWSEYTGSAEDEALGRVLSSTRLDPAWDHPAHLEEFEIEGAPLLAIDREHRRVCLNEAFFVGAFNRPDATRLRKGERQSLGRLRVGTDLSRDPSRMVLFMLKAHLVLTYAHIGAALERTGEGFDSSGAFRSEWRGKHTYFTSQEHEGALHFLIQIDLNSGKIEIEGL